MTLCHRTSGGLAIGSNVTGSSRKVGEKLFRSGEKPSRYPILEVEKQVPTTLGEILADSLENFLCQQIALGPTLW